MNDNRVSGENKLRSCIEMITSGSPDYPALLKEIKDYPRELYYIGNINILRKRCVSVVGSRNANQYGNCLLYTSRCV